jgi:hypothetical protein
MSRDGLGRPEEGFLSIFFSLLSLRTMIPVHAHALRRSTHYCRIEETITGTWGNPDHPFSLAMGDIRRGLASLQAGKSWDDRAFQIITFCALWVVRLDGIWDQFAIHEF